MPPADQSRFNNFHEKYIVKKLLFVIMLSHLCQVQAQESHAEGCNSLLLINNSQINQYWSSYKENRKAENILLLDFENNQICVINKASKIINDFQYNEIKAKFGSANIKLNLTIKWKQYDFVFNPDYTGGFLMRENDKLPFLKSEHVPIEFLTRKTILKTGLLYKNLGVGINNIFYTTSILVADVETQIVGFNFIKGFNWILDFKNNKVYVKKNSNQLE